MIYHTELFDVGQSIFAPPCYGRAGRRIQLMNSGAVKSEPVAELPNRRIAREWETAVAMIQIYCGEQHGAPVCPQCLKLMDYVRRRLERCRFAADKPTCANCPVHCYQRDAREQIKAVMRYAGPRMIWRHPALAVLHAWDGWRRPAPAT